MLLADLDLAALEEKSAPDRWGKDNPELDRRTFFDPERQVYYKVWGPLCAAHRQFVSGNSAWAADIRTIFGFEIGFFSAENCPALVDFITDADGFVRGYITRAGQPLCDTENPQMASFIEQVKMATVRSGFVHNDVCYNNLILIGDRISFIDFDTVFSDLQRFDAPFESEWGALRPHVLEDYAGFVQALAAKNGRTTSPLTDSITVQGRQIPIHLVGHLVGGVLHPVDEEEEQTTYSETALFEETYVPHVGWFTHHARDPIARSLREGCYESDAQAFCWLFLREGDAVLDFGSRFGVFAVLASSATNQAGRVTPVERNPKYAELLRSNAPLKTDRRGAVLAAKSALARVDRARQWVREFDVCSDDKLRSRLPLIVFTGSESARTNDDADEVAFFRRLAKAGYVFATFNRQILRLVEHRGAAQLAESPLFATLDLAAANKRLETAAIGRIRIARDIIARGDVGERLRDGHRIDELKLRAADSEKLRKWAQDAESNLKIEKQSSAEFRRWAERAQAKLEAERKITAELREWAESVQAKLKEEHRVTSELREWAESAQAKLNEERKLTKEFREWAESAEARVTAATLANSTPTRETDAP